MPTINVKTVSSQQVWASPDGQRKIHEVVMDYQGQQVKAKTYSDAIAVVGWSGDVITEERPGRNGPESFVKQPPKEGGYSGGGGFRGGGGKTQDPFAMYLSYAKDLAVAFISLEGKLPLAEYKKALTAVAEGGEQLFNARPEAKTEQAKTETVNNVKEVMGDDVVVEDVGDEPISLADLPDL